MTVQITIPPEFEGDFYQDRFEDALQRLAHDAHLIAGNYEIETAHMLISSFKKAELVQEISIETEKEI